MKKFLEIITNRWFIATIGFIALGLLIWFFGPLLGFGDSRPFESVFVRLLTISIFVSIFLIFELVRFIRSKRASDKLGQSIVESDDGSDDRSEEEVAALKERFEEAVSVLKKTGSGKRQGLYELPWYIIIGPPGSGKTTALVNSGLRFPLADRFGKEALRGIGGTRNCDWWFTEEAILLDTAGRYTTQDSEASVDKAAWEGFLGLLKRYRKRRPINGVIVAISLADLIVQNDQERFAMARAVRERIQELDAYFGMRFPVYLTFTKCDLVAGFMEFFEDLGAEERKQVWGMTFELAEGTAEGSECEHFGNEFDALLEQLESRLLSRMRLERDQRRRQQIYIFPRQLGSLKPVLNEFIEQVFRGSRFDQPPMLRGVYLTSGTQEGAPIDRVMAAMARTFGLDQRGQEAFSGQGRSYFLTDLLNKVIFPESEIAGTNRSIERRLAWLQTAAYFGVAVLSVALIMGWIFSYSNNDDLIDTALLGATESAELLAQASPRNRDVTVLLPTLNVLRNMPGGYAERESSVPLTEGLGLYQGNKLGGQAESAYRRVLEQQLLPRIMLDFEAQIDRTNVPMDYTYEGLKAYLMLGSEQHYDSKTIGAWVQFDWDQRIFSQLGQEQYVKMLGHLEALLEDRPVPLPIALDIRLVERARTRLARVPLEERIYTRLKGSNIGQDLPPFTIFNEAGPDASIVFVRKSGQPLSAGIPGLFTKDGYLQVFTGSDNLDQIRDLMAETWVLRDDAEEIGVEELPRLLATVQTLYLDEYVTRYEDLIYDIKLAPFRNASDAVDVLNILSRPGDSPLLLLIDAVNRETTFSLPEASGDEEEGAGDDRYNKLRKLLGSSTSRIEQSVGRTKTYVNQVEEAFADFHSMSEPSAGGTSSVDYLMGLLRSLADFMMVVERQQGDLTAGALEQGKTAIQRVQDEAQRQDEPLIAGLMNSSADSAANIAFGGVAAQLNAQWQSGPLRFCQRAIEGRYPLIQGSKQETRLEDFGRFFGFGGSVDAFFESFLTDYIDTTRRPWRVRSRGGMSLPISNQAVTMFEKANAIKEAFFRGDTQLYVGFDLVPVSMDASVNQFTLDLDGQGISYFNGPIIVESLEWPGPGGTGEVRIEMAPRVGKSMRRELGPWAWFRVLDDANLQPTGRPEQYSLTFKLDSRSARYRLTARSAYNPFDMDALHSFSCISKLTR